MVISVNKLEGLSMHDVTRRIDSLFATAASDSADKTFLVLPEGSTATYAQTFERAKNLGRKLVEFGIKPGDRVACLMRNSRELIEIFIACGLCGAISTAINTLSTRRELERIFQDCTPSGLFTQGEFLELFADQALVENMRCKVVSNITEGLGLAGWNEYEELIADNSSLKELPLTLRATDAAMMIYSSGTTGLPKGIVLSHQALIDNAIVTSEVLRYRSDDRWMTILPLFSSFGFAFDFLHVGLNRGSVVLLRAFNEAEAVRLIDRCKVTFLAGVPTMFARIFDSHNISDHDISSLRMIDVGGGPVSLRLKKMLKEEAGVAVVESYGLTEISPVASAQDPEDMSLTSSCGAPLPGFEAKVVDAQGNEVAPDMPGELIFRSNTFMLGYWQQPEQTAEVIKNGWLKTGDIARIDTKGEIHILDRTKDVMVVNGFNVYPKEVENSIAELSGVRAVAVVSYPDEIRGETIHAFVVPKTDCTLDVQAIMLHCTQTLSKFKRPRGITILDDLPLTASGKVQRFRLREMLLNQLKN